MRTKIGHSPQNSCGTRFPHHIRPMRPNRCSALLPDPAISFSRRKPPPNKKATILVRTASPDRVHPAVRIARPASAAVSAQHFVRQGERTSYPRGGAAIRTVPASLRPYARSVSGPGLQTRPADADGSDMRRKRRSIFPQHAFLRTRRTGDELRNRIGPEPHVGFVRHPDTIVRQTRRTYPRIADRNTFPNAQPRIKRDCLRLVGQPRAQSGRAPAKRRDGNTPRCERSARNEPEARHESMRSLPRPDNAPHRTPTPPRRFAADDPKHLRPPIRSSKRRSAAAAERSAVSAGSVPQASPPNSIR